MRSMRIASVVIAAITALGVSSCSSEPVFADACKLVKPDQVQELTGDQSLGNPIEDRNGCTYSNERGEAWHLEVNNDPGTANRLLKQEGYFIEAASGQQLGTEEIGRKYALEKGGHLRGLMLTGDHVTISVTGPDQGISLVAPLAVAEAALNTIEPGKK